MDFLRARVSGSDLFFFALICSSASRLPTAIQLVLEWETLSFVLISVLGTESAKPFFVSEKRLAMA